VALHLTALCLPKINVQVRRHVAARRYDAVTSGRAFADVLTDDHDRGITRIAA